MLSSIFEKSNAVLVLRSSKKQGFWYTQIASQIQELDFQHTTLRSKKYGNFIVEFWDFRKIRSRSLFGSSSRFWCPLLHSSILVSFSLNLVSFFGDSGLGIKDHVRSESTCSETRIDAFSVRISLQISLEPAYHGLSLKPGLGVASQETRSGHLSVWIANLSPSFAKFLVKYLSCCQD